MMRAADFNGDGLRDLVFINADRASLDFLYQLAPGESKPAKPRIESNRWEPVIEDARFRLHRVTTGDTMLELAVGDFNHDGLEDLAYTADNDPLVIRYQESPDEWNEVRPPLLPAAHNLVGSLLAGDVNGDGWVDLVVAENHGELLAFENRGAPDRRVLRLRLEGKKSNRAGIGARIVVEAAGAPKQTAEVQAGGSYLSQNSAALTFGLAQSQAPARATVQWPDGKVTKHEIEPGKTHDILARDAPPKAVPVSRPR